MEVVGGVGSSLGGGQQVWEVVPRWPYSPVHPRARLGRLRAVVGGRRPLVSLAPLRTGGGGWGGSGALGAGAGAREAACPTDPGGSGGRGTAGGLHWVEVYVVGGLGPGQHSVGGQRAAGLGLQLGAAALAADLPDAVLPVGGTGLVGPLGVFQVLVGVPLLKLAQPAQRLGPFPCRQAGPAQGVGAGDGQLGHLGDDVGDVVLVADKAPPHDGLRVGGGPPRLDTPQTPQRHPTDTPETPHRHPRDFH